MPLARIVVDKPGQWFASLGRDPDVATSRPPTVTGAPLREYRTICRPAHTCCGPSCRPSHLRSRTYPLELDDRAAPLAFPDARKQFATSLDDPLVVDGKVRAAESWGHRGACRGAARAPDFYLTSVQPLQKVTVSLLWARAPQKLFVYGPIEHATATSVPQCGEREGGHSFDVFEGSYAVWVGGDDAAASTDYHVLVMRAGTKVDPMSTLVPVPTELALADRAVAHHYPYFRGAKLDEWTKMFTTAPEQLFAYTRADIDKDKIPAGEPLLVQFSNEQRTAVYRDDGTSVQIDTRLLTTTRPDKIVLPTAPRVPQVTSLDQAIDRAGPEDDKAIAAYRKLDD